MVIFLVLLTVAVMIAIELLRQRKAGRETAPSLVPEEPGEPAVVFERYFHPGHSWALVHGARFVTVGVDDFAQRFIGRLDGIDAARLGSSLQQGDPLVTLRRGSRSLTILSPISGTLIDVNARLSLHPALANSSPYEAGWVAKIAPDNLATELRNLFRGSAAERWLEGVQAQLIRWFSPQLGLMLQDGGEWIDNLSDLLTEDDWHRLAREFFPSPGPANQKQTEINNGVNP